MQFKEHVHPHSQRQLSPATATQKRKAGRKKFQETRHPVYNGVRQRNGKWVSELRQPYNNKSRIWLGAFSSPQMAARAYDVAAFALRGDSDSLDFPESAHLLPQSKSFSIRDIQIAAMRAADQSFNGGNNENIDEKEEKIVFIDEEELFNMPTLIDSMAEGLILTPPALKRGFSWDGDCEEDVVELTLWTH